MQLHFLGGASGVGASCQLLTLGGHNILVDVGVRMDTKDRLPDLAALTGVSLDAILITHAHADHIGALPLVAASNPATPIYASPATIRLMEVMLGDAVRVMARRAADELELPLYDEALVEAVLRRLRPLREGVQTLPELPGIAIYATRAGHIAGAVSLGFEAADGSVVISGDVSASPQRTILGAAIPAPRRPDLLVLESTYGARLHPNRAQEEQKLAEAVATVITRGGHCLIPAFALGRAQEVILILRAAQRDGLIPPFPIAVDGLVRAVCGAYASFPEALTPALRRHIIGGGKAFFTSSIQPVDSPQARERVLAGPPCAIIASSGMLTGGPSVWYAERLAASEQAAIFFSGYQDGEAPGFRLLALADAPPETRRMKFGELELPVICQVGRYSLSAHADGDELAAIVRALQPRSVALVHGDPEARAALSARLKTMTQVLTPRDGQILTIAPAKGGRRVEVPAPLVTAPLAPVGAGAPLDDSGIERLWLALRDGTGVQSLSVRELARAWYGDNPDTEGEVALEAALEAGTPFFVALPNAPGLWRLPAPTEVRRAQAAGSGGRRGPRPNTMAIQAVIDRYLGAAPDLYQRGVDTETGAVTLRYFFPAVAAARDAEAIALISAELNAPVTVWPQPHQGQLAEAALAVLPSGLTPERAPAIYLDTGRVEVRCTGKADLAAIVAAEASFAARTGLRLSLRTPGMAPTPVTSSAGTPDAPGDEAFVPPRRVRPSELNFALDSARRWFGPESGFYKASADQPTLTVTLRFHFPETARAHYATQLAELATSIGWTVRLWPQPHQEALTRAAREALPAGMTALGAPALRAAAREVELRVQGAAPAEAIEAATATFTTRTGWRLTLRRG